MYYLRMDVLSIVTVSLQFNYTLIVLFRFLLSNRNLLVSFIYLFIVSLFFKGYENINDYKNKH